MKEPFLLLKVPLKWFPIQKDHLDFPSSVKGKKLVQGLSLDGHFDGLFSGSSKRLLNSTPAICARAALSHLGKQIGFRRPSSFLLLPITLDGARLKAAACGQKEMNLHKG